MSRALKQLESAHIIARVPYQEPMSRARDEYRLTAAGEDLLPVLLAMIQWGDTHLQNGEGPLKFIDSRTGRPVRVCVTTGEERRSTRSSDIRIRVNSRKPVNG